VLMMFGHYETRTNDRTGRAMLPFDGARSRPSGQLAELSGKKVLKRGVSESE